MLIGGFFTRLRFNEKKFVIYYLPGHNFVANALLALKFTLA